MSDLLESLFDRILDALEPEDWLTIRRRPGPGGVETAIKIVRGTETLCGAFSPHGLSHAVQLLYSQLTFIYDRKRGG